MKATRWVLLCVVAAMALLPAVQAVASDARLESLALQREYVEDYFNFRTFPTVAARYSNLATVGLGSYEGGSFGNDRSVGVIGAGDNTSYGVFAVYLNQATLEPNQYGVTGDHAQFDITWAKDFESMTLGLGVLYQNSSWEQDDVRTTPIDFPNGDLNQLFFTGGVRFGMGEASNLELAAKIGWLSFADSVLGAEDAGNISYDVAGRIMAELSDRTTIVPLFRYGKMDFTADAAGGTELELSETSLNAGVALNYEVNGSDLLILGVSADYSKSVDEVDDLEVSGWSIPTLFLATEFDVYSWLTMRAGARKTFDNVTEKETGVSDVDIKVSDYSFGLGFGLHFDHFDVDASLNPDWIFTGGYLLSGDSTDQPLTRVTATYYF